MAPLQTEGAHRPGYPVWGHLSLPDTMGGGGRRSPQPQVLLRAEVQTKKAEGVGRGGGCPERFFLLCHQQLCPSDEQPPHLCRTLGITGGHISPLSAEAQAVAEPRALLLTQMPSLLPHTAEAPVTHYYNWGVDCWGVYYRCQPVELRMHCGLGSPRAVILRCLLNTIGGCGNLQSWPQVSSVPLTGHLSTWVSWFVRH